MNITFITLTFLFLIHKKVLLLNEETLILLCFIIFVFLNLHFFKTSVKKSFDTQADNVKLMLSNSIAQICILLTKFLSLRFNFNDLSTKIWSLGNYYYKLVSLITRSSLKYNNQLLNVSYKSRLIFLDKVEKQTTKLLTLVVLKKLDKIVKLKQFYRASVKINHFVCLEVISLREYLQLITLKNK